MLWFKLWALAIVVVTFTVYPLVMLAYLQLLDWRQNRRDVEAWLKRAR